MFSRSDVLQELPNSSRNATLNILARVFASTEPTKMNFSRKHESTESSTTSIWIDCFFLKPYKAISMQQAPVQPPFQPRRLPAPSYLHQPQPSQPRPPPGRQGAGGAGTFRLLCSRSRGDRTGCSPRGRSWPKTKGFGLLRQEPPQRLKRRARRLSASARSPLRGGTARAADLARPRRWGEQPRGRAHARGL